jgi:4-hydroxy-tetrahydrodipicolinate synthase
MMKNFGRLLTAMVTPFDSDGNVDYSQAKKLAAALTKSGNNGVVVCGTTGESPTVRVDEKLRLFKEIKAALGDKGTVVAGTGSYNTAESCELTREAEKAGVDACLLVVPYYNRPTQDGLYQHFKTIAESTNLPCILYNVPSRTVTSCTAETVIKLSEIENIVGIKEASANFEQIARIIEGTSQEFLVYSGNDGDTFPIITMGGYGVVGVITHLVGLQVKEMIQLILDKRINEAATIHRSLLPLVNALFVVANPMPVKYALNYLGFKVGKPRLPLVEPDEKSKAFIEDTLRRFKIDLQVG